MVSKIDSKRVLLFLTTYFLPQVRGPWHEVTIQCVTDIERRAAFATFADAMLGGYEFWPCSSFGEGGVFQDS